jgi:hypothetical protein
MDARISSQAGAWETLIRRSSAAASRWNSSPAISFGCPDSSRANCVSTPGPACPTAAARGLGRGGEIVIASRRRRSRSVALLWFRSALAAACVPANAGSVIERGLGRVPAAEECALYALCGTFVVRGELLVAE